MLNKSVLLEAGIDTDEGLKYSGHSLELYESLLEMFVDSVDEQRAKLMKQLDDKDYEAFAVSAHSVKSNARTIGAGELFQLGLLMEKSGDNKDATNIANKWDEFVMVWDQTINGIREYLQKKI